MYICIYSELLESSRRYSEFHVVHEVQATEQVSGGAFFFYYRRVAIVRGRLDDSSLLSSTGLNLEMLNLF